MRYLFFLFLLSACSTNQQINEADLVLTSNKVILMTGNEQAEALSIAIKNKQIIWIGTHKDGRTYSRQAHKLRQSGNPSRFYRCAWSCILFGICHTGCKSCLSSSGQC
jgi:hypothetical protein